MGFTLNMKGKIMAEKSNKNQTTGWCCNTKSWRCILIAVLVAFVLLCIGFKIGKTARYYGGGYGAHHGKYWAEYGKGWAKHGKRGYRHRGGGSGSGGMLRLIDANGDWQVTKDEFEAFFDRLDVDNDGIINNEIGQWKMLMREQNEINNLII